MINEIDKLRLEHHVEIRPQITVEDFIAQFENLEAGRLYKLPNYPSDAEAQEIAKLKIEISVMELSDGEVLIAKGKGKTQTAFTRGDLLALKPKKKAHTHPVQPISQKGLAKLAGRVGIRFEDIDQEMVAFMGTIIPSPEDLTVGSIGATTYEIWSEYGRTTYVTYSLENEEMLSLALQMTAKLYAGKECMTILVHKGLSIEEKVAKMNSLLKLLGLSFDFQPWDKPQKDQE